MEDVVATVAAISGLDVETVKKKIADKKQEAAGMLSDHGAAYMVAKELGVSLFQRDERLHIANIVPGIKDIEIVGKIVRLSTRNFETDKAKGSVTSVILGDETGTIRLSLWNDEQDKLSAREGDVIRVRGYTKEGLYGNELRLGKFGTITKSSERIDVRMARSYERTAIAELSEHRFAEVRACVVKVFESNPFYEICPQCGGRVKGDGTYTCDEHGDVEPAHAMVVSGIIDDGTENIRAVFFRDHAEAVLGIALKEARDLFIRTMDVSKLYGNVQLGKEYILDGAVRNNILFNRLEFIVNGVRDVEPFAEIRRHLDKNN